MAGAASTVRPRQIAQPASGHHRIACGEPCELYPGSGSARNGTIWNLSVVGVYLVVAPPLPPVGASLLLTFALPNDPVPITCEGLVRWHNEQSIFPGCGSRKLTLPPGCGIEFGALEPADKRRIAARVSGAVGRGHE